MENLKKTCASLNFMTEGFLPFHWPGRKRSFRPFWLHHRLSMFSRNNRRSIAQTIYNIPGFPAGVAFRWPCCPVHEWISTGFNDTQFTRLDFSFRHFDYPGVALLYNIRRCGRMMVSINYYYQTFKVMITILPLNESTLNICHCCKCWSVLKPIVACWLLWLTEFERTSLSGF